MLLAQPISRLQAFAAQAVTTTAGVALLAFVSWLGIWIGIQSNTVKIEEPPPAIRVPVLNVEIPIPLAERTFRRVPMSSQVDARDLAPAAFNLFALGFCMAGIATLVSSCDRYRWRTIGVATGVLLVQYVMKGFAITAASLGWMSQLTLFTPYEPLKWVSLEARRAGQGWAWLHTDAQGRFLEWGPLANNAVLLGIGLTAYLAATVVFNRRDLPAPL
jgi:ABC-2 type transport system permease protein